MGDLGYIKDGSLFITGRSKDIIIVNGKNIYATDIEQRIEEQFPHFIRPGCTAAFQTGHDTGAIVCEIKPGKESLVETKALKKIMFNIEMDLGVRITDIICTTKGSVPKTTSGKIKRLEARRMFLANEFHSLSDMKKMKTYETFEELLVEFDVNDFNSTLIENGVDSLMLTHLIDEAQSQFGIKIDFDIAQTIACCNLASYCLSADKSRYSERPSFPEIKIIGKKVDWLMITQLVGVLFVLLLFCASSMPSVYLYRAATGRSFITNHQNVIDPLLIMFQTGPGMIFLITILVWMTTFSFAVLVMKWILIGRYKPVAYTIWSFEFFKWW